MLTTFFIRLCFIFTHLSNAFDTQRYLDLGLFGQPSNHTEKRLRSHSVALSTLKNTSLKICEQSCTVDHSIFMEICPNVISLISIIFVLTRCLHYRIHRNSINRHRATLGSHIWSRKNLFWRHARVSRASYIAYALNTRYYDNNKLTVMQQHE